MYIEMTTFSVPSFVVDFLKFSLYFGVGFIAVVGVLSVVIGYFYDREMRRGLRKLDK